MSLLTDSEVPDQTAQMYRLIWAFAVYIILFPKTYWYGAIHMIIYADPDQFGVGAGGCEGVVYLTSPGHPTDIGLHLDKACYPCGR